MAVNPRQNPALVGQDTAEKTLLDAWASGRMPHAWVFAGPGGVGKATTAFRLARFLFAHPAPPDMTPNMFGDAPSLPNNLAIPENHPGFRMVASGSHPDMLTVERVFDEKKGRFKQDIPVDEIKKIAPFLRLTAAEGGWRVVIVDGGEAMNRFGQNALLKILEEPPPRAILIVITDRPGGLLPTIRSRCRMLHFSGLDPAHVNHLLADNKPELNDAERMLVVRLSDGSIGRALSLADTNAAENLMIFLETVLKQDKSIVFGVAEKLAKLSDNAYDRLGELYLGWLERLIRDVATGYGAGGQGAATPLWPNEAAIKARLLPSGLASLLRLWEKSSQEWLRADSANLDRKVTLLTLLHALNEN